MRPLVSTRRNAIVTAVLCGGLATSLTACGGDEPSIRGSNGVGELPAKKIEDRALKAARKAESVRLSGTVSSKGETYRLEMRLKESGGIGEVAAKGGDRFQLLRVGKDLFLKADSDFWVQKEKGDDGEPSKADKAAAKKLEGKYVKVPQGDPTYKQLSGFTKMDVLLGGLLVLDGERETGERAMLEGTPTIQVVAADGRGGTITVSLEGAPYPLRLERPGGAGTVRFQGWNKDFSLRAPKEENVVDYGKKIFTDEDEGDGSVDEADAAGG